MNETQPQATTRWTDSPWFWLYAFTAVGLALVILAAPRWIERQARLERRAEALRSSRPSVPSQGERAEVAGGGASRASQAAAEPVPEDTPAVYRQRSRRELQTLLMILVVVLVSGWAALVWQTRRRAAARQPAATEDSSDPSGGSATIPKQHP